MHVGGDLVVESTPINSWALARVIEVVTDKKDSSEVGRVKTKNSILLLSIDQLCLILEAGVVLAASAVDVFNNVSYG